MLLQSHVPGHIVLLPALPQGINNYNNFLSIHIRIYLSASLLGCVSFSLSLYLYLSSPLSLSLFLTPPLSLPLSLSLSLSSPLSLYLSLLFSLSFFLSFFPSFSIAMAQLGGSVDGLRARLAVPHIF